MARPKLRITPLLSALSYVGAGRDSIQPMLRAVLPPSLPTHPAVSRITSLALGSVMIGVAVELLIQARLGLSPFDAFAFGLGDRLGLTLGQSGWLLAGVLFAVAATLGRRPGPWAVAYVLLCGVTIDATSGLLASTSSPAMRAAFLVAAIVTMGAGIAAIVNAGIGGGPFELLMLAGHDRGMSQPTVRIGLDGCVLFGAIAAGGPVGLGTLVYAAAMGPTIHGLAMALVDRRAGRELRRIGATAAAHPVT